MTHTVRELADKVQGKVLGDEGLRVDGITNAESPAQGLITFAQDEKTLRSLEATEINCIIIPEKISRSSKTCIQVKNPKLAWAQLLAVFYPEKGYPRTLSKFASIAESAKIGAGVTIEPFAVIGDHAVIGAHAVIRSFVSIAEDVKVGEGTVLHPGVTIYRRSDIGKNVIIHAGTVIGADGFGYVTTEKGQEKVPQVGHVVIQDEVEIGASCAIDRATIGATVIGRGTKIDNLVQIGHNVTIGCHTVISAETGISGSCKIGNFVTMGGKTGIGDHVEVGDFVMLGAGTGIPTGKKIPPRSIYIGAPARPYQEVRKQVAAQLRAAETLDDVKALRVRVSELEKKLQPQ
ncbi:MAG: UDP-3-O-(3-hydroxymyristoyl)glucosamine N-acyltransferase [Candidatus Omnitrophota bacterium]